MRNDNAVMRILSTIPHRLISISDTLTMDYEGDAEIARPDNTRLDNAAPNSKGGHRGSGQRGTGVRGPRTE